MCLGQIPLNCHGKNAEGISGVEISIIKKTKCILISFFIGPKLYGRLTDSAVTTHDVTTGTGYCHVGFNWIIDFLN